MITSLSLVAILGMAAVVAIFAAILRWNQLLRRRVVLAVADRTATTRSLERVNRVLMTLSQGNEALVRAADETELYATMCKVIVIIGGYRMAWIGVVEHDPGKTIKPVASYGADRGYLPRAQLTWDKDHVRGQGPSGQSIRSGMPQINNDTGTSPVMTPWRADALERGFLSSISLPLKSDDGVFGCLTIYAAEPNAFGGEETTLFIDLANDISYGISALRERQRRAAMEHHLSEVQKLEALGQLAGGVAHDFNNLLGAMLGFADFIAADSESADPTHYHAQRIIAAGQRGKALVAQILSFARRSDIKQESVPLAPLLADIRTLVGASIPATTQVTISDQAPATTVTGDPDRLTQLLLNLCLNAHDALGGRPGTVALTVRPTVLDRQVLTRLERPARADGGQAIDIWTDDDGKAHAITGTLEPTVPYVSLVVSDSGCGMDAPLLQQVFAPFFTTKAKGAGTGLGLAVVHGVVLAHGGALAVESAIGAGTSFDVILPVAASTSTAQDRPQPRPCAPPTDNSGRVLLVEDDTDFGDMLLTGLERRGFEVSPTNDPQDALTGLRDHPGAWDAMIADHTMPGMTGLDLIKAAKALQPDLPCILCTGYTEDHIDDALLQTAGVFALIPKPVALDDLVATLQRAIAAPHDTDPT